MQIRFVPPSPHPSILYAVTFPNVLPLHDLGASATMPAAWSSQLQILTSMLHLEPPSSIHMLDRAVGLVTRVQQVSMDLQRREVAVTFIDGREVIIPMNSDCVRMLSGVVADFKICNELECRRNSTEGSACSGSTTGSAEELPSGGSPTRSLKLGKHKRQRSLLFSLISSLVPKSLSSSSPPPPSAPPSSPLPPLPVVDGVTSSSPVFARRPLPYVLAPTDLKFYRRRIRATLVDVWRRHVISAFTAQHLPAAGYAEWTLIAMASEIRAEMESMETIKSHGFGVNNTTLAGGSRHRRAQSEGRNALDFGDRKDDCDSDHWRCRAPSPFPDISNPEDIDRVVYPRREQADEWGVRHVHHPRFSDEADVFAIEYSGHNNLGEHFAVGDDWDGNEQPALELTRTGRHGVPGIYNRSSNFEDGYLYPMDFDLDCSDDNAHRLGDMSYDVSRCPLIPSDVNDEGWDDSQISPRAPEDREGLSLVSVPQLPGLTQHAACSSPLVSRASSSRPRPRNASAQYSSVPPMPVQALHPHTSLLFASNTHIYRDIQADEYIASRLAYLEQICNALEIVRGRAREEGWRSVRATLIGAENGWSDAETERSLEIRAKRRAWSSGVKISAPYSSCPTSNVWDSNCLYKSAIRPLGRASRSRPTPQMREPIIPTGLPFGIPVQSSPLAMYAWGAVDGRRPTPSNKYGILGSVRTTETVERKRPPRVTFADVTKLFPVCEDDSEDSFEPVQVNAVGFPQAVPLSVSADESERDSIEELAENEDDPFHFAPSRPRTRTTSMYAVPPPSSAPPPQVRCTTPPPSYQAAVGEGTCTTAGNEGKLDASALLLQPLSSLTIPSWQSPPRPALPCNSAFIPRPRAVSLPASRSQPNMNKIRRTSFNHKDEHCEDLSQVYASPPPEGPLVVSAAPAPHEQYPRYAHVQLPVPAGKKGMSGNILGRMGKEVTFEQDGSGFTVGIEVALGRAEEGRVVW